MQDEALCPRCQQLNGCERANGKVSSTCWCDQAVFPSALLAESQQQDICICQRCQQTYQQHRAGSEKSDKTSL